MVFATEFDPREQSQRRPPSNRSRSKSATQTSSISLQEISALEQHLKAHPKAAAASRARGRKSARGRSVAANHSSASQSASNVVPLQVGAPAQRVRLDTNATLSLPQQPKLPLGLRVLTRLQQGSTAVTGLLVTAALVVYGSTVYIDKSTSKAIVQLDELQGESQQLTSANESIKQSLAQQAIRPDSGLEPYEAGDVLFVEPAAPRQKPVDDLAGTAPEPTEMPGPLGY